MYSWQRQYREYPGHFLIFQGPSGAGKNAIITALRERYPQLVTVISETDRPPREGEVDGVHYEFVSNQEFMERREDDWYAETNGYITGYLYGTPRRQIEPGLAAGQLLIGDADVNGIGQLFGRYGTRVLTWVQVTLRPLGRITPSVLRDYEERIVAREPHLAGTPELDKRLGGARAELEEMRKWHDQLSAYTLVNECDKLKRVVDMVDAEVVAPWLERLSLI